MNREDRLLDLLAARATEGLSEQDSRETARLLRQHDGIEADDFDLAAAAAYLAFQASGPAAEPMPEEVKRRILAAAPAGGNVVPLRAGKSSRPSPPGTRYLGWYVAAAMLLLALWSPWTRGPVSPALQPSFAEQRESLMRDASDVIRVAWARPEIEAYAGVEGDVVWSGQRQAGFMRLRGLPPNRRSAEQYQLWIVDPARDRHPVDGGVFDIPPGVDEVIVPIDAKLSVVEPAAFAITLEQPGGVVVSDGPLLVVAPVRS